MTLEKHRKAWRTPLKSHQKVNTPRIGISLVREIVGSWDHQDNLEWIVRSWDREILTSFSDKLSPRFDSESHDLTISRSSSLLVRAVIVIVVVVVVVVPPLSSVWDNNKALRANSPMTLKKDGNMMQTHTCLISADVPNVDFLSSSL